jgi:hypothetical protein
MLSFGIPCAFLTVFFFAVFPEFELQARQNLKKMTTEGIKNISMRLRNESISVKRS